MCKPQSKSKSCGDQSRSASEESIRRILGEVIEKQNTTNLGDEILNLRDDLQIDISAILEGQNRLIAALIGDK